MTKSTQVGAKPRRRVGRVSPRQPSPLDGPMREVVYIFERVGTRGGKYWLLVLECGHPVARSQQTTDTPSALLRPLSEKLAPRRAQCHHCGSGGTPSDPWVTIEAFGGPEST